MDKNTQQNAAMVEEATAASESLNEEARKMAELVSFFRVAAGAEQQPQAPARKRPRNGAQAIY